MPNNKIPGTEIDTRVAQLRQTLESVSRGIAGQQAEVAALRQRLQDLVGDRPSDTQPAPGQEHGRALAQIADALGDRLHDLQDAISRMQLIGAELRACQAALEQASGAAGAPREPGGMTGDASVRALQSRLDGLQSEVEGLREAGARRDAELLGGVAAMRERAATMDQQLRRLIEAQEGLELQLALLSKEAEDTSLLTQTGAAPASDRTELSRLAERLDAVEQRLPAGDAPMAALQPDLVERLAGLEQKTERLGNRVSTFDGDRQTLRETIKDLGVQQARLDTEARTLARRLRLRSLLGLLLVLLGASVLAFALLRTGPPREATPQTAQSAAAADAIAELRAQLDALRTQTDRLGTALAQVSRRVDALTTGPSPAELAARLERLQQLGDTVDGLAEKGARLERGSARLEAEQERLGEALDAATKEIDALQQAVPPAPSDGPDAPVAPAPPGPSAPAVVPPAPAPTPTAGARESRGTADAAPPATPAAAAAPVGAPPAAAEAPAQARGSTGAPANGGDTEGKKPPPGPWERARAQRRFTLQLIGVHERQHLAWFLKRHRLEAETETAVHHTRYQGRPWLVLLYGIYDSQRQALAAARRLPPDLAALRPWVRRIPAQGRLEPL